MGCCGAGGIGFGRRGWRDKDVDTDPTTESDLNPEGVLKLRLARGEITVEQYRSLLDVLHAPNDARAVAR